MAAIKRPISEIEDEDRDWEMEAILEHRSGKNGTDYRIKWKDSPQISWEPRKNITNGEDILAEYWAKAIMAQEDPPKFCQDNFLELGPWYKSLIVKVGPTSQVCEDLNVDYEGKIKDLSKLSESDRALVVGLQRNVLEIESKMKTREHPRAVAKIAKIRSTKNSNRSHRPLASKPISQEAVQGASPQQDRSQSADFDQHDGIETVPVPTTLGSQPLSGEAVDNQVHQDQGKSADLDHTDTDEDEPDSVALEPLAFPCKFHGCKKSFRTNKGRLDHGRYHRVIFCKENECKWKGPVKRFNQHLREKHPEINDREGVMEARKKAGLSPVN